MSANNAPVNNQQAGSQQAKNAHGNQTRGLVGRLRTALNADKKPAEKTARAPEPLTNRVGLEQRKSEGPQLADMAMGKTSMPNVGPEMSAALGQSQGSFPPPYKGSGAASSQGNSAPGIGPGAAGSSAPNGNRPAAQPQGPAKEDSSKRDWRSMWGKAPTGLNQPPGQSTVEPTPSGRGPIFPGMNRDNKTGTLIAPFSPLPPTSVAQNSKQSDPLLNPERSSSAKVENKALGDRRVMAAAGYRQSPPPIAPPAAAAAPSAAQIAPVGAQSVVAANNGLDMPLRFVPVPMVTLPQPMRPPAPPRPDVPQPPAPSDWVNAFSSAKPPANGSPTGPVNPAPAGPPLANMGGYMPGPYGPYGPNFDPRMAPGMPMTQPPYGPNPYANAYGNPAGMIASGGSRPPIPGGHAGSGQ